MLFCTRVNEQAIWVYLDSSFLAILSICGFLIRLIGRRSLNQSLSTFSRSLAMSKSTQPIPPGHENLIPHLVCDPCSEAIEFYKKAFGAVEIHRMPAPDGRRIMHAAIRIGKSIVFLVDDFPEFCGGKS